MEALPDLRIEEDKTYASVWKRIRSSEIGNEEL